MNGAGLRHGRALQICLQNNRKQVGAQAPQNPRLMKTLGQQVKDFRTERKLKTADLAKLVKTSRQNIESLESTGNRIPKYLGALAAVMGTTADAMLAEAGLRPPVQEVATDRDIPTENRFDALTPAEQQLLNDFSVLDDDDQLELAAEIERRAIKARAFIQKTMRRLGLTQTPPPTPLPFNEAPPLQRIDDIRSSGKRRSRKSA